MKAEINIQHDAIVAAHAAKVPLAVLAFDPGTFHCGYALLNIQANTLYVNEITIVSTAAPVARLAHMAKTARQLIDANMQCLDVVLESYFPQPKMIRGATAVSQVRGCILEHAYSHGILPIEMNASHARKIVLGKGCSKEQAHSMFHASEWHRMLTPDSKLTPDAVDAAILACAGRIERSL